MGIYFDLENPALTLNPKNRKLLPGNSIVPPGPHPTKANSSDVGNVQSAEAQEESSEAGLCLM